MVVIRASDYSEVRSLVLLDPYPFSMEAPFSVVKLFDLRPRILEKQISFEVSVEDGDVLFKSACSEETVCLGGGAQDFHEIAVTPVEDIGQCFAGKV